MEYLKRKVIRTVLGKVKSLGFYGNPFDGIVAEAHAFSVLRNKAFFGAENLAVSQRRGMNAIAAAGTDLLAK